jgi:hypothetical protein
MILIEDMGGFEHYVKLETIKRVSDLVFSDKNMARGSLTYLEDGTEIESYTSASEIAYKIIMKSPKI